MPFSSVCGIFANICCFGFFPAFLSLSVFHTNHCSFFVLRMQVCSYKSGQTLHATVHCVKDFDSVQEMRLPSFWIHVRLILGPSFPLLPSRFTTTSLFSQRNTFIARFGLLASTLHVDLVYRGGKIYCHVVYPVVYGIFP